MLEVVNMYIHVGEEKELLAKKIIGIFDNLSIAPLLKNNRYQVIELSKEDIKSAILVQEGKTYVIYLSPISTMTLNKRWRVLSSKVLTQEVNYEYGI